MIRTNSILFRIVRYGLPALLTVLWLCFIFSNSLRDSTASSDQSQQVYEVVNDVAQTVGIEKPITHSFVRKSAHFTEFAVLALLFCCDLLVFGVLTKSKKWYGCALWTLSPLPLCALLATVDECIQTFSEGRAPQGEDVLIDTLGSAAAAVGFLLIFLLVRLIVLRKKQGKNAT